LLPPKPYPLNHGVHFTFGTKEKPLTKWCAGLLSDNFQTNIAKVIEFRVIFVIESYIPINLTRFHKNSRIKATETQMVFEMGELRRGLV